MARADLLRRLQALEAQLPSPEDLDRQRADAIWQAIFTHPDAADLLLLMDEVAILMKQNGEVGPEVWDLLEQIAEKMNGTNPHPAPRRTR